MDSFDKSPPAGIIGLVVKLAAAGCLLAAALALLVTLYVGARTRGLEAHCRNNLRQLGDIAWRNRNSIDPERTGRDFWQAVREAQYRDVRGKWQPIDPDPFICPVLGSTRSNVADASAIDYRGPAKSRDLMKDGPKAEPLGADRTGNHPSGGFVLRLDTSVDEVPRLVERVKDGDPLWAAAAAALKD
ncbi:MAG TPA: hypothetical protein VKU80_17285 [Planctomycetota bacterium]|nr:hypothetical protein [Planctomycetota bacterium]